MSNTEFIVREKSGMHNPLLKATQLRISLMDAALAVVVLAVFVGVVLMLAK